MRWWRCVGAGALTAVALLALPGANAALAAAPSASIDSPVADSVQKDAFTIAGSAQQEGNGGVIDSLTVRLSSDDGWGPPEERKYTGTAGGVFTGGGASVSFNWTGIKPAYNGPYAVTVEAVGHYQTITGPTAPASYKLSKSFTVEIAPSVPTGVTATKPEDSGVVTVKWKANPESDVAGYVIYRSYAGDAGKQVGSVDGTKTTWSDDLDGKAPGQYKYALQAVRHARSCKSASNTDEACSRGIAGKTSAYSTPVTVRATAPTTTTTTAKKNSGGSGGGSGGGGTGPGATTTSTAPRGRGSVRSGTGGGGIAPGSEVDLSKFGSLLNPSGRSTPRSPGEAEGTFDQSLPYGERALETPDVEDDSLITIGGASLPRPNDDWVKFIGAGSLVTALLVHVLWFKQQVDQIPLEPIND
ncbi:MAG TPA: hypothetical protein VMZ22_10845 [Acidimicrobiales bacterium]|nr:hypothetical protein [Acidimicrobiales bacterium]